MQRQDWYSFISDRQKAALAEEYKRGPQIMKKMGPHWGNGETVICVGDDGHAMRAATKLFYEKFHGKPCRMGYYGPKHGGPPLPSVHDRLMQEGYL